MCGRFTLQTAEAQIRKAFNLQIAEQPGLSPCYNIAPSQDIAIIRDTEAEQELAGTFGIQSIPSILFIPVEGQPQMAAGALPKATFEKIIKEDLGVE